MFCNLTGKQLLFIILGIIILLWLIKWLMSRGKKSANIQSLMDGQVQNQNQFENQNQITTSPQSASDPLGTIQGQSNQDSPFILYYFYNPNCGACKKFSPTWNEVANKLKNAPGISVRAIDNTKPENERLSFYYNITRTPTIIFVTPNKNIEYSGERTADDIYNFIITNLNEYAQQPV